MILQFSLEKTGPSSVIEFQYRHFSKAIKYVPEGITDLCTLLNCVWIHSFNPSQRKANTSTSTGMLHKTRNWDNNISFSYPRWLLVDIGFQATGVEQFLENFILDLNLLVSQSVSQPAYRDKFTDMIWPICIYINKTLNSNRCQFFSSSLNHKTKKSSPFTAIGEKLLCVHTKKRSKKVMMEGRMWCGRFMDLKSI